MTLLNRLTGDFRKNFSNNPRARALGIAFVLCAIGCGGDGLAKKPSSDLRARMKGDFAKIDGALEKYKKDLGTYPNGMEGLVTLTTQPARHAEKWKGPYLTTMPKDPWGKDYVYRVPGKSGRVFDLYSLGADGKADTWDDYRD
jgi:type II secretion system protein G